LKEPVNSKLEGISSIIDNASDEDLMEIKDSYKIKAKMLKH
jgi:hypothetical protein